MIDILNQDQVYFYYKQKFESKFKSILMLNVIEHNLINFIKL